MDVELELGSASSWRDLGPGVMSGWVELLTTLTSKAEAWCAGRPDVASLDLEAIYDELRQLDTQEKSMLPRRVHADDYYNLLADEHKPAEMRLRELKREAITSGFDARRLSLRSRAMELSRPGVRPLNILDLPLDIMRVIFDSFQEPAVGEDDRVVCWVLYCEDLALKQRQTLHEARLVCRLFHELATPLLFPILRVHISQSSLNLVDNISKSRCMAAGVRGVLVSVAYRPKNLADDIAAFKAVRIRKLEQVQQQIQGEFEFGGWSQAIQEAGRGEERVRKLTTAWSNMQALRKEWEAHLAALNEQDLAGRPIQRPLPELQHILCRGFEFRLLHQEQFRLLTNGDFVSGLTAALARMGNVQAVRFVDSLHAATALEYFGDNTHMLTDAEVLSRFMTAPLDWRTIHERHGGPRDLECARIMSELPIALHKAAVTLRELDFSVIPFRKNLATLGGPGWEPLSDACAKLEAFSLSPNNGPMNRHGPLADEDKILVDSYLGSMLSKCGPSLRHLHIDCRRFYNGFYPAGSFLGKLQGLPQLRVLDIREIELTQAELKALCNGLANRIRRLSLYAVRLSDGRWANAIDTLRDKTAAYRSTMQCLISIVMLSRGEFDEVRLQDEPSGFSSPLAMSLLRETERYVQGIRADNPLRDPMGAVLSQISGT
ncbi:hypothetical protein MFIFM68171_08240 [Madurella fahalii]|uniref:F-box domain-containing protein n=1 Tax=Madurella fahalii TaxID=1157608 RepID=A0ABQ0GKF2_9PEZI